MEVSNIRVLLVEDDPDDYRLLKSQLKHQSEIVIDWVDELEKAEQSLCLNSYDVVLTDLSLRHSLHYQTVSTLRSRTARPIIVLTSLDDEHLGKELLGMGVQDYWVKGEMSGSAMLRAIRHAIQRDEMQSSLRSLLEEREDNHRLLMKQAELLKKKNRRLKKLYRTTQEFVDNVSHDLRTPLTVIKDFCSIMRDGMIGAVNEDQVLMLEKVLVRADDLNNMVDDLLDASKLEAGLLGAWRRNTSVDSVMHRIQGTMTQRAQLKGIDLSFNVDPGLPDIYCDGDLLSRVLVNLAVNAIKFSAADDSVSVWARLGENGKSVAFGVTDTGPGIDAQSLDAIFQRFERLGKSNSVKGHGLGLNISHRFCSINLGRLQVSSQVGEGTTFWFDVPVGEPREIFYRWIAAEPRKGRRLQLASIATEPNHRTHRSDEFDSFLCCLVLRDELLIRTSAHKWLLFSWVNSKPTKSLEQRLRSEYSRNNRNRPLGPLPPYTMSIDRVWDRATTTPEICADATRVLEKADAGRPSASAAVSPTAVCSLENGAQV